MLVIGYLYRWPDRELARIPLLGRAALAEQNQAVLTLVDSRFTELDSAGPPTRFAAYVGHARVGEVDTAFAVADVASGGKVSISRTPHYTPDGYWIGTGLYSMNP